MRQAKFSLTEEQLAFVEEHRLHGFKDKSELVRAALERLRRQLIAEELEKSAQLCAELYDEDSDSQAWVADALLDWPE